MVEKTEVTLYHSSTCPYCVEFMPTWNTLKKIMPSVSFIEYEHSKNPEEMEKANIEMYPTIKIKKNGVEKMFNNERTIENLQREISGGSSSYESYKKYKTKYLLMKKKLGIK